MKNMSCKEGAANGERIHLQFFFVRLDMNFGEV